MSAFSSSSHSPSKAEPVCESKFPDQHRACEQLSEKSESHALLSSSYQKQVNANEAITSFVTASAQDSRAENEELEWCMTPHTTENTETSSVEPKERQNMTTEEFERDAFYDVEMGYADKNCGDECGWSIMRRIHSCRLPW